MRHSAYLHNSDALHSVFMLSVCPSICSSVEMLFHEMPGVKNLNIQKVNTTL